MSFLDLILLFLKVSLLYAGVLTVVPVMIWAERKGAALIQDRPGPNRVGWFGALQPIADAMKFLMKEDPIPLHVNKVLYVLGPFLALLPASLVIAAIPFGDLIEVAGRQITLQIADLDVGIIYVLAVSSLGIYGILFGGWASNNKFSLIGAMRASSQVISYEIPLALAAASIILIYGTFSLREMALFQEGVLWGFIPNWGFFLQPLGFLLFFISAFAETNRLPFDLPESEAELVAGYHTEYGSMKFAAFFMAEYINLTTSSALMVTLFFGSWHLPWVSDATLLGILHSHNLLALLQVLTFSVKVTFFLCIFIWVRWTLPRFRFDQLMRLAWGSLIPLGLLNLVVSAVILYLRESP